MTTSNANTMSYTLASKRANHAAAKAADAAAAYVVTNKAANKLAVATAAANAANDAKAAKYAAAKAADAAVYAAAVNDADAAKAAIEVSNAMRTVCGVFAYMSATLDAWVARRADVVSATFERHATAKTAAYRIVIVRDNGRKLYMSVNTTAALDWRKIDANLNKRLAKLAAKDAAKAAK